MKRFFKKKLINIFFLLVITVVSIFNFPTPVNADSSIITEFLVPGNNNFLWNITSGPDGNLWFTEFNSNKIGKITPNGDITEFQIPIPYNEYGSPYGITSGPDGNLWFTESDGNKIGRITPSGIITQFHLPPKDPYPDGTTSNFPYDIVTGPDGNLWFTEYWGQKIGRIAPNGVISEFPLPPNNNTLYPHPQSITTGPDSNLWFTEIEANKIGRITPEGIITEFDIPTNNSFPYGIASGSDGNIWFTENNSNKIGRITPNGNITEFPLPNGSIQPYDITSGSDGNLWFTEQTSNKIARITTSGQITEFLIPTTFSYPRGITTGPEGNIWFTESSKDKIGRVNLANIPPIPPAPPCVLQNFGDENGNPVRQTDPTWKDINYGGTDYRMPDGSIRFLPFRYYGNNQDTIGAWGCNLTSAVMIINYFATQQGSSFRTDPAQLNTWLQHNQGYYSGSPLPNRQNPQYVADALVIPDKVVSYSVHIGGLTMGVGQSSFIGRGEPIQQYITRSQDSINNSLCALNPVILGVNNSGHFVDATGKTVFNNINTWRIHNPLQTTTTTLQEEFSNLYTQARVYTGQTSGRRLVLAAHSPVELVVTDPNGNKAGFDPTTNTTYSQIQNATYGDEFLAADDDGGGLLKMTTVEIANPLNGVYAVQVFGIGNGDYSIDMFTTNDDGDQSLTNITGTAAQGVIDNYLVQAAFANGQVSTIARDISFNVKPGNSDNNKVNPKDNGKLSVTVFSSSNFDATTLDIPNVKFGRTGTEASVVSWKAKDVDKDGIQDLILDFNMQNTGILCEDTLVYLKGHTIYDELVQLTQGIQTIGCAN